MKRRDLGRRTTPRARHPPSVGDPSSPTSRSRSIRLRVALLPTSLTTLIGPLTDADGLPASENS
ncbi:MAG TPA: hypothetical protein VLL69_08805 [Streptosporangiaceae bacterium]|nr:hypothetical protein [Streptosporangiaceae bacterium]